MSKGNFGSGIIGFVLGLLSFGLFAIFKHKKSEQIDYTVHDADHNEITRVTKE